MELLDRYLISVKQALTGDNQDDIIREIKANILDELDAREQDGEAREQALIRILERYGHPCETAQQFAPHAPLVSSSDMPLYKTTLWHGAALIFVFALIKTLNSMLHTDSINPFRLLFQTAGNFLENAALMAVIITLCFYVFAKHEGITKWRYKSWTLDSLPTNPLATMKLSDSFTDLTSSSFLLLLIWSPLWMNMQSQQSLLFSLAPEQAHWRIILTVLCVFSLLFALYRLTQSHWKRWNLGAYVAEHVLFGLAFLWMASVTPLLVASSPEVSSNWPVISEFVENQLQYCIAITGVVILVLGAIEARKFKMLAS